MRVVDRGLSLELRKTFEAPVPRVFEAWTDARQLEQWFGPPNCRVESASVDLRPGGCFSITLVQEPLGIPFRIHGAFRSIEPPRRLVCTWNFETPDRQLCSTVLKVEFLAQGTGTQLRLRQELLMDEQTREHQREVIEGCLRQLEHFLE